MSNLLRAKSQILDRTVFLLRQTRLSHASATLRLTRLDEILRFATPLAVAVLLCQSRWEAIALAKQRELAVSFACLISALVFVFSYNDLQDAEDDRQDPRKRDRNVITAGSLSRPQAQTIILGSFSMAVVLGVTRNTPQQILLTLLLLLGFLYSWRQVRLKAVPFVDCVTHGFALGALPFAFLYTSTAPLDLNAAFVATLMFFFSVGTSLYNQVRDWCVDRRTAIANTAAVIGYASTVLLCFSILLFTTVSLIAVLFL